MEHLIACGEPLSYRTGNMAFCSGAGIKLAGAAPEVGVVGEGNQGIVLRQIAFSTSEEKCSGL
jgi:hypothetical protein